MKVIRLANGTFRVAVTSRHGGSIIYDVKGADDEADAIAAAEHMRDFPALEADRRMMGVTVTHPA